MITINKRSGIRTPKDLEGKRIGTELYTQTAAIFVRSMLPTTRSRRRSVENSLGAGCAQSRRQPWQPVGAAGVAASGHPAGRRQSFFERPDRQGRDRRHHRDQRPGGDEAQSGRRPPVPRITARSSASYFRRTGIFPIMHLVAMRRDVHEKHPFVATSLYAALKQSRQRAWAMLHDTGALRTIFALDDRRPG